jgi:hypothetical protein
MVTHAKSNMDAHRIYSAPTDRTTGIICDQTLFRLGVETSCGTALNNLCPEMQPFLVPKPKLDKARRASRPDPTAERLSPDDRWSSARRQVTQDKFWR